jgi:hypothetical protein
MPARRSEELTVSVIRFLGEQDGPPERELKSRLADLFRDCAAVQRAYLSQVDYANGSGRHVALCILSSSRIEREIV